jgi:hypothetical protein
LKKGLKYGLLIFGIVIITIFGFIGFGFYSMEIEDHYGNYQEIYYKSKNFDIIVNVETSEYGIVEKNWKRLNVWTKEKDSTDLYTFVSKASYYSIIKLYRPKSKIENIRKLEYNDIQKLVAENELKLILEHQNE